MPEPSVWYGGGRRIADQVVAGGARLAGAAIRANGRGKGANLPDFDSDLPIASGDLPLIVQLRNNASGVCWEGTFSAPKKNDASQFNAKQP